MRDRGTDGQSQKIVQKVNFFGQEKRDASKSVRYSFIWTRDTGTKVQAAFFGLSLRDINSY